MTAPRLDGPAEDWGGDDVPSHARRVICGVPPTWAIVGPRGTRPVSAPRHEAPTGYARDRYGRMIDVARRPPPDGAWRGDAQTFRARILDTDATPGDVLRVRGLRLRAALAMPAVLLAGAHSGDTPCEAWTDKIPAVPGATDGAAASSCPVLVVAVGDWRALGAGLVDQEPDDGDTEVTL